MRTPPAVWLCCVTACLLAACSQGKRPHSILYLQTPDELTLYSIDGRDFPPGQQPKTDEQFHGYPVLGKVEMPDEANREKLMQALNNGLGQNKATSGFSPRYGLRAVTDGHPYDYVICFECERVQIHNGPDFGYHGIDDTPRPIFNEYLTAAGIELAPPVEKGWAWGH